MNRLDKPAFDPAAFLAGAGVGRRIVQLRKGEALFSQGAKADSVFYIQKGHAKLAVVSRSGREATISLLSAGDFVGEESMAEAVGLRSAGAIAIAACTVLKIDRKEILRLLHEKTSFSEMFVASMLTRSMRTQADLVDHLFNSSEKRLARILLLMADFGEPGEPLKLIPRISQESLANQVGTTRARVSLFMNRFRKLGFIEYNGAIHVNNSLLSVVLHDRYPSGSQTDTFTERGESRSAKTNDI
jgi:CRP-like cAMP-binding protein